MENLLFSGFNVNIVNILGFYALLRKERQCTRRNFSDISVTQMMNYYKMNGHIDLYSYNEGQSKGFNPALVNN